MEYRFRITAVTFFTKWLGGDVVSEMVDGVNDYGFAVNDSTTAEKARLGYDQATSSGVLSVSDSSGEFFTVCSQISIVLLFMIK